jgi:hypothetical protein
MTLLKAVVLTLAFACVLGAVAPSMITHAQTSPYAVTVPVDPTTAGDLAIINDFFNFAPLGSAVSQSLRRIYMAAVGEMTLATDAAISDAATLTLNDGSTVPLQEGDTIEARAPNGAGPIFVCKFKDNPHRRCQPEAVCHPTGNGGKPICMAIPPNQKCPIEKECLP